jgi:hypothetical protein
MSRVAGIVITRCHRVRALGCMECRGQNFNDSLDIFPIDRYWRTMLNLRRLFLIAGTFLFIDTLVTLPATAQQDFQSGYIVHAPTDTLHGQIDYRDWVANPRQITFLDGRTGKKSEYGPQDISAFL